MRYFTTTSKASRRAVDCVIAGIYEGGILGVAAEDLNTASKGAIQRLVKSGDVSAESGNCTVLNGMAGVRADRIAVVGLGKAKKYSAKTFAAATAAAVAAVAKTKAASVLNCLTLEPCSDASAY
jgi:leucyl aminopeptidase